MNITKDTISSLCRAALLFLFIGYSVSLTLFYHAHVCDGQVVFHSHPFKSDKNASFPYATHTHSPGELAYIQELNGSLWEEGPEIKGIPENVSFTPILPVIRTWHAYCCRCPLTFHLRAPPQFEL